VVTAYFLVLLFLLSASLMASSDASARSISPSKIDGSSEPNKRQRSSQPDDFDLSDILGFKSMPSDPKSWVEALVHQQSGDIRFAVADVAQLLDHLPSLAQSYINNRDFEEFFSKVQELGIFSLHVRIHSGLFSNQQLQFGGLSAPLHHLFHQYPNDIKDDILQKCKDSYLTDFLRSPKLHPTGLNRVPPHITLIRVNKYFPSLVFRATNDDLSIMDNWAISDKILSFRDIVNGLVHPSFFFVANSDSYSVMLLTGFSTSYCVGSTRLMELFRVFFAQLIDAYRQLPMVVDTHDQMVDLHAPAPSISSVPPPSSPSMAQPSTTLPSPPPPSPLVFDHNSTITTRRILIAGLPNIFLTDEDKTTFYAAIGAQLQLPLEFSQITFGNVFSGSDHRADFKNVWITLPKDYIFGLNAGLVSLHGQYVTVLQRTTIAKFNTSLIVAHACTEDEYHTYETAKIPFCFIRRVSNADSVSLSVQIELTYRHLRSTLSGPFTVAPLVVNYRRSKSFGFREVFLGVYCPEAVDNPASLYPRIGLPDAKTQIPFSIAGIQLVICGSIPKLTVPPPSDKAFKDIYVTVIKFPNALNLQVSATDII
jgi:hypothetical protein